MEVKQTKRGITVELVEEEVSLLKLTLMRATFEDTPPDKQRQILDFASELLRTLQDRAK